METVNPVAAETVDDNLWSAMGDPIRRRVLDFLLMEAAGTATTLSKQLPISRQAVTKHLGVLNKVGLVRSAPAGRERRYRVDDVQLARAVEQMATVSSSWDARLQEVRRISDMTDRGSQG
jgi:predicted transcriptional regulator